MSYASDRNTFITHQCSSCRYEYCRIQTWICNHNQLQCQESHCLRQPFQCRLSAVPCSHIQGLHGSTQEMFSWHLYIKSTTTGNDAETSFHRWKTSVPFQMITSCASLVIFGNIFGDATATIAIATHEGPSRWAMDTQRVWGALSRSSVVKWHPSFNYAKCHSGTHTQPTSRS